MKKTSINTGTPDVKVDEAALVTPFVKCLARLVRAQDTYGSQDRASDAELLAHFIITEEQRREIPIIAIPVRTSCCGSISFIPPSRFQSKHVPVW